MAKPRNEAAAARVRACAEMGFTISQTCKALSMSMAQADRYAKSRGFTFRDGRRKFQGPSITGALNCSEGTGRVRVSSSQGEVTA